MTVDDTQTIRDALELANEPETVRLVQDALSALDRLAADIARLTQKLVLARGLLEESYAEKQPLRTEIRQLRTAAQHVVGCYHRESEDANDGEFALWKAEDLVNAIVALRAALAGGVGDTAA